MDKMKNLDCNQVNIFINLEIIREKKLYIYILNLKFLKNFYNMVKSLGATTVSKLNFYYIVYDMRKMNTLLLYFYCIV